MPRRPPTIATSLRLAPEVADLLTRLAELRGSSKADIVVTGILAQAELYGLIPSLTDLLAQVLRPEPVNNHDRRLALRLSQQRSRARRAGQPVPKRKPGPPRKLPTEAP